MYFICSIFEIWESRSLHNNSEELDQLSEYELHNFSGFSEIDHEYNNTDEWSSNECNGKLSSRNNEGVLQIEMIKWKLRQILQKINLVYLGTTILEISRHLNLPARKVFILPMFIARIWEETNRYKPYEDAS